MATNWIEAVTGVWVLLSPWLLGFSDISLAKWSCVISGLIVLVIAISKLFGPLEVASAPTKEVPHKGQSNAK